MVTMDSFSNGITETTTPVHFPAAFSQRIAPLTRRESEVLYLMADGLTTKAIGVKLGVTFKTAACHRGRILNKLGVDSSVLAVRWAIRQGFIKP